MSNVPSERKIVQQIGGAEIDVLAQFRLDPPMLVDLVEMPDQHLDGHAALHFEGGIEAFAGAYPARWAKCRWRRSRLSSRPGAGNGPSASWQANRVPGRWNRPRSRCARCCCAARRSIRPGSSDLRSASKGWLSRKKEVSLVVMASTTLSFSALRPGWRSASTRAGQAGKLVLAQDRRQPRLQQIDLVRRDDQAGALLEERGDEGEIGAVHAASLAQRLARWRRDPGQRQNGGADAGIGHGARHAPDHAGGFVLGDDRARRRRP